ncbi:PAS domain-containing protein [Methylomicrobium sp. RS1]|nr:PAS domain-containing protein [Methylomicrobium sp. RS1]
MTSEAPLTAADNTRRQAPDFPVAGIGASAGGIEALQRLFKALPHRTGLAFAVIQHLLPEQPSRLVELLQKATVLPVCEARDGMTVEADHVYVIAPGEILALEEGRLRSRPFSGSVRPGIDTIDTFFESLAAEQGTQALAVVLSGSGSDGAAGAIRVRQAGGLVFVQDPLTAQHDGMPLAAIAAGAASHILPIEAIAAELLACLSPSYPRPKSNCAESEKIAEIVNLICRQAGFDLSGYKLTPLLWRIQQRMHTCHIDCFRDYAELLRANPSERESLIRNIPIYVTEFFRDPDAWEVLAREVIAPLVLNHDGGRPLRVWTPACSSGEEAYSVAMLLAEQAEQWDMSTDFQLFATDVSPDIVARAGRGVFSAKAVETLSPERLARFFDGDAGKYRVKKHLREKLVFVPQHLLADPPFSDLDLVTCRNLLIYLEPSAQQQVLTLLQGSLRLGGYLFLGRGEALPPKHSGFEVVSRPWCIYRKTGPALDSETRSPKYRGRPQHVRLNTAAADEYAHRALVERFDLPSVLIDDQFNILRVYGDTRAFLRLPPGEPTLNLLQVVQPALVADLLIAAEDTIAKRRTVTVDRLQGSAPGEHPFSLRITPLQNDAEDEKGSRLLISFVPTPLASGAQEGRKPQPAITSQGEAAEKRSDGFQFTIEELESSREELRALNEELRTVNDQLNFSNEEVGKVNAQLRAKIEELETQSNMLSSGEVMALFLDDSLRIRWFTAAINALFPLRPADIGREITDFVPKFNDPHFIGEVHAVMRTGEPSEGEVVNRDGRWFLRRIRPYLDPTQTANGAAMTFTDITERKRAEAALKESEEALRKSEEQYRTLFESIDEGFCTIEVLFDEHERPVDYRYLQVSPSFERQTGIANAAGRLMREIAPQHEAHWFEIYGRIAQTGEPMRFENEAKALGRFYDVYAFRIGDPALHRVGVLFNDITERKRSEEALRNSEEKFRTLSNAAPALIWYNDAQGENVSVNQHFLDFVGMFAEAIRGIGWHTLVHPDDRDAYVADYLAAGMSGAPGTIRTVSAATTASGDGSTIMRSRCSA